MRDDYHRKIVERLRSGELRPKTFEACACDLLRDVFPGLVPIPGGNDAGMDGAIPDGLAEAFPLVCTTAQDVSRNLRASLESYVSHGGQRRKVALATSQALTARKRRNLEKRANERDFTLVQVFDQASIANRLYHSPRWCRELLDLPAQPSALATLPNTRRPFFETELIGRDKDLAWLRETSGDRILAGQPGAGKTYLLFKYSQEVKALFLESSDEEAVGAALLEHEPEIVIVDDAHVHDDRLELLRRLRSGHEFSILAVTWPGDVEQVSHALGMLSEDRVHSLELLTRDELVEVYRQAGITEEDVGPDILRDLVTQGSNKPGLALTLAMLWHEGAWGEVLRGEALRKNLVPLFKDLVGEDAVVILACFGLGGEDGFTMMQVAEFLALRPAEIRQKAVRLAAGGVLSETGDRYSVEPSKLRSVLLAEVFFSGAAADLPWRNLMMDPEEDSRSFRSTVEAIVLARHHGAQMDRGELQGLVARADSKEAWRGFTALDPDAAEWALEQYLGPVTDIAGLALRKAPEHAVQKLLRFMAASDQPSSAPAMSVLNLWICDPMVGCDPKVIKDELFRRRKLLLQQVQNNLARGADENLCCYVAIDTMNPHFGGFTAGPGSAREFRRASGCLPLDCLNEMWVLVRRILERVDEIPWQYVEDRLRLWFVPRSQESEGLRSGKKVLLTGILNDLAPMVKEDQPWVGALLSTCGRRLSLELQLPRDLDFETLYPQPGSDRDQWPRFPALEEMAGRWRSLAPRFVAEKLSSYRDAAERIGWHDSSIREEIFSHYLVEDMDPESWLEAFVRANLPMSVLGPPLRNIVRWRRPGWKAWLNEFLLDDQLAPLAVEEVLKLSCPPQSLLERSLDRLSGSTKAMRIVENVCWSSRVALSVLGRLLTHEDRTIRLAAVVGAWNAEPLGSVQEEVRAEWQTAVQASAERNFAECPNDSHQYWLGEILSAKPELACSWIRARLCVLDGPDFFSLPYSDPLYKALAGLNRDRREELLEACEGLEHFPMHFFSLLVGDSNYLFRKLLASRLPVEHRLRPLEGPPKAPWAEWVEAALEAGIEPETIARSTVGNHMWLGGAPEGHWEEWSEAFAPFSGHPHKGVRATARLGAEEIRRRLGMAASQRRDRELERGLWKQSY